MEEKEWEMIEEVEKIGGMKKDVERGLKKRLIEEEEKRRKEEVEKGEEVIVGVKKLRMEKEEEIDIIEIEN